MSQYKIGSVTLVNGSNVASGESTLWSGNVSVGSSFRRKGALVDYEVAAVNDNSKITFSSVYAGSGESGAEYEITKDFTSYLLLPEVNVGDIDWPQNVTKALRSIDSKAVEAASRAVTGDPTTSLRDGLMVFNSVDGTIKLYGLGAFRTLYGPIYTMDHINEVTADHGVNVDGVTLKDGGALIITGGTNTFNLTNGTASLDVAAAATVDIDKSFAVGGASSITITGVGVDAKTITLNESITIGDGYAGTLTFGVASKTLTVNNNSIIDQDVSTTAGPTFDHVHTASIIAPAASLIIKPTTDATTAIQIADKDGNVILNVDTTNNRIGIGTTAPSLRLNQKLDVSSNGGESYGGIALNNWESGGRGAIFDFNSSNSDIPGTHAAKANTNVLGILSFRGSDGTVFQTGAFIQAQIIGTPSAAHMPTDLQFFTSSTTVQNNEIVRITSTGNVGIGTTNPSGKLDVALTTTANAKLSIKDVTDGVVTINSVDTSGGGANDYGSFIFNNVRGADNDQYSNVLVLKQGNVGIGQTTFGTSAAKVLAIASGTAPTTSPADAAQIWVADEGGRAGYAHPHIRNEAGQSGAIAIQAPLVNLLPNTEGKAMSGSTLENVGTANYSDTDGSTFAAWTTNGVTLTDGGANLLITQTVGAAQQLYYPCSGLTIGNLYKVTLVAANGTGTWGAGANDLFRVLNSVSTIGLGTTQITAAGTYTVVWEATEANNRVYIDLSLGAGETLNITSITIYEATSGYVAANTVAPDGGTKTATLDILRVEADSTHCKGYYGYKYTKGADTAEYHNILSITSRGQLDKFKGQTVAFGMAGYSTTATDNLKIQIYDGVTAVTSSAFWGADTLAWQEITQVVASNATELTFRVLLDGDTNDVAYGSFFMAILGISIGAYNYSPKPSEIINCQANIALTDYTASAVAADATINLEAQSSGKIGKGIKAVHGWIEGQNSAADKYIDILSASGGVRAARLYCQVNAKDNAIPFRAICDANGDIYVDVEDGNWTNVTIQISAIET